MHARKELEMLFAALIVLKTSVLLLAAWASSIALRRASAAVRHAIWATALIAVSLLPAVSRMTRESPLAFDMAAPELEPVVPVAIDPASVAPHATYPIWVWLWAAGAALIGARFVVGAAAAWRMARRGLDAGYATVQLTEIRARLKLRRRVRMLESELAPMPMNWGLVRPVVLLPCGAAQWPEARLRSVLLHEIVHIRRFDVVMQFLAQLACALHWFNPLVWFASRELRNERERACDDAVLALGVAAPDYAEHLVDMVRAARARRRLSDAVAMAESRDLEGRVRALLDRRRDRRPVTRRAIGFALCAALAVLLPLAAIRAQTPSATGALAGIVTDPSGATVPRCQILAKNQSGSNQEAARANDAGEYQFAAVPAGSYTVEFRAPGFVPLIRRDVLIEPGRAVRADAILQVGSISETIVVTGKRPLQTLPQAAAPRRIRVGGNVQATRLISASRPVYPERLQQLGIEGTVLMRAVISIEGGLLNLEVISTGVNPDLAKAALEAVRQWRYQPTLLNGQPVEVATTITVEYRLEK
jgi:TonB family protein